MKITLLGCLLAAPFFLFAQTVDIKDISWVLTTNSTDSLNTYLETKGFTQPNKNRLLSARQLQWEYKPDLNPDGRAEAILSKSIDNNVTNVRISTADRLYYNTLINQLPDCGFIFAGSTTDSHSTTLTFGRKEEEAVILVPQQPTQEYVIILRPAPPGKYHTITVARHATARKMSTRKALPRKSTRSTKAVIDTAASQPATYIP